MRTTVIKMLIKTATPTLPKAGLGLAHNLGHGPNSHNRTANGDLEAHGNQQLNLADVISGPGQERGILKTLDFSI